MLPLAIVYHKLYAVGTYFLDLYITVPQNPASRSLRAGRSQRTDVSALVRGHSSSLPCRTLLKGFLGSLSGSHPRSAALSCRKGKRANGPCGTLEQYPAKASGSVCTQNAFSKSLLMHHACLTLLLNRYNRERAIMLM